MTQERKPRPTGRITRDYQEDLMGVVEVVFDRVPRQSTRKLKVGEPETCLVLRFEADGPGYSPLVWITRIDETGPDEVRVTVLLYDSHSPDDNNAAYQRIILAPDDQPPVIEWNLGG